MSLELEQTDAGVVLPIKALPGSRKNQIRGIQNGRLKISVTQVAEKGKANKALIALLAKCLKISKSRIQLASGETRAEKRLLITGVEASVLRSQLLELSE